MIPQKPNHNQDDPPKDPEILRWFQALGPPPVGHVPPNLRATVLARIEQQRERQGVLAWMALRVGTPAMTAALALGLLLSVGFNIWLGVQIFGARSSDTPQVADSRLRALGATGTLAIYRFQTGLSRVKELGTFVAARSVPREPPGVVGFTPQAARTAFFRMGTLYADALAALQGGAVEAAAARLDVLTRMLASVQAPRSLAQYLREMQTFVQSQRYRGEDLAMFLALFEPLYGEVFAHINVREGVLLFRAGAWMENLSLAAAAGEAAALRQEGQTVKDMQVALAQLSAPREAIEALEQLHRLMTKQTLSDGDIKTIGTLVQTIQERLSA